MAYISKLAPVPVARWGEGTIRYATRRAVEALAGVGVGPVIPKSGKVAIHFRRALSEEEMGNLSSEWLAIPARDEFSEEGEVEMNL